MLTCLNLDKLRATIPLLRLLYAHQLKLLEALAGPWGLEASAALPLS